MPCRPSPTRPNPMTELQRLVALAISPNINEQVPEEWLPEAVRAIRAVAFWLREEPLDLYPGDRALVVNTLLDQANG